MHPFFALVHLVAWATIVACSPLQKPDRAQRQGVTLKLTRGTGTGEVVKRANGVMINNRNAYWLSLGVGTPPQDLSFLSDSGANDFSVYSTLMPANKQGDAPLYDPSRSSTAKQLPGYTWSQFGSGVVYNETITIGGQVFNNVPLCVANNQTGDAPQYARTGNMGMNPFDQTTSPNYLPSLMHSIMSQLPKPIAAYTYNYYLDEGELDIGFIDTTKYTGSLQYLNVDAGAFYWTVHCSGLVLNGSIVANTAFDAIVDTGSIPSTLPRTALDAYFAQVTGAVFNSNEQTYDFPCDANLPDVNLAIAFLQVLVPKNSWIETVGGTTNTCRSRITVSSNNSGFFGTSILGSIYLLFDYQNNRIGLANRPAFSTSVPTLSTAGTLKLCSNTSFSGTCTTSSWKANTCVSLVGNSLYHNVGSYSPSQGYCTLYSDDVCGSPLAYASGIRPPGASNTYGYKTMIGSYACFYPSDYPYRGSGTFQACTGLGFRGTCQTFNWSSFACQNLPTALSKNFQSAQTNTGYCYLYTNRDCTGAAEDGAPFVQTEDVLPVGKKIQSFMCT